TKRYLHLGQSIFLPTRPRSLIGTFASQLGHCWVKLFTAIVLCLRPDCADWSHDYNITDETFIILGHGRGLQRTKPGANIFVGAGFNGGSFRGLLFPFQARAVPVWRMRRSRTSCSSREISSATGTTPTSPATRSRTATVPAACSFSPTTSMYGT